MGIAVTCLSKDKASSPVQRRFTSPQQKVSSTGFTEGSARAFPAWPNEQEVYGAGGGRKRGRGLDQNDPHCWIWALKGSRSWRYKHFSPSECGCTLLQDCREALAILSQESGLVKGLLSANLDTADVLLLVFCFFLHVQISLAALLTDLDSPTLSAAFRWILPFWTRFQIHGWTLRHLFPSGW